uniref:Uncharacterized protein n=1 Tax=Hucho hucho TaxID=62062 RepID=A0A4W5RYQ1_9TELE
MNNTELAQSLLNLYGTPDNIDMWLGGVAEPFVPNGHAGPHFSYIIATQFQKIRQGDVIRQDCGGETIESSPRIRKKAWGRHLCLASPVTTLSSLMSLRDPSSIAPVSPFTPFVKTSLLSTSAPGRTMMIMSVDLRPCVTYNSF